MPGKKNVIIVDDHPIYRDGLRLLLSTIEEIGIIETTDNGLNFIEKVSNVAFDLALVDIKMPGMSGIEAMKKARIISPCLKFIVISGCDSADYVDQALQEGASGYILKDSEYKEIKEGIIQVLNGYNYFSPRVLIELSNKLNAQFTNVRSNKEQVTLTEREFEVLDFISHGYDRQTIAQKLFISERTVDKHKENLLQKTKSSNSVKLLLYAIKNKLIEIQD